MESGNPKERACQSEKGKKSSFDTGCPNIFYYQYSDIVPFLLMFMNYLKGLKISIGNWPKTQLFLKVTY